MSAPLRLLLVEDDDALRRALVRTFADQWDVVDAGTCADARSAGVFDLAIFDIDLPDGGGAALARELLDGGSVKFAVFFTGSDPERARGLGPVVAKGAGIEELQAVVSQVRSRLSEMMGGAART